LAPVFDSKASRMIGSALTKAVLSALALAMNAAPGQGDVGVLGSLQGGVIEGVVYDSTLAQPLADARVFLWNTQKSATADVDGAFRIEDVAPGDYYVVFFHPRLTSLGVSSGRTPIHLGDGDHVTLALSTPSRPTIMSLLCEVEDPARERGRAIGFVGDASTGVPLPGARVIFTWRETDAQGRHTGSAQAMADPEGWYSLCTLPPAVEIEGRAYFFGQETRGRTFTLARGSPGRVDFTMGTLVPGTVTGRLRDAETNRPIEGVEVVLADSEFQTVTDGHGRFTLEVVPPGPYSLVASHLAYGRRSDPINVEAGIDVRVEMEMSTRPIELAPLLVIVRSEAEKQAMAVGGRLVSREMVDGVRAQAIDVGDLLNRTNIAGIVRVPTPTGVCVGFRRGQVSMQRAAGCQPAEVYINDVPASSPIIAMNLAPEFIDRIILVPPLEAGVQFGADSAAGVILIYTRSR